MDKEVREWIGASIINHSTLHGSVVPRKNESIELSEEEATAICLQNRVVGRGLEMYVLTSNTKSIKKTLVGYLKKTKTPGKIEYADSNYKLTLAINFAVTTQLLSTLKRKTIKEKADLKHVICEPVTKTYLLILQANATLTYKIAIPPSYYNTPVSLLNAINKGMQYDAELVYDEWSKWCAVNLKEGVSVKLSEYFSTLLGFAPVLLLEESVIGDSEISLRPPISNVLVYTNIVEPSVVGRERDPILKMAPFLYEENKQKVNYTFQTVQYFKLSQREITSISVRLCDDTSRKLPLRPGGRTALTLHFRKHVR